MLKPSCEKLYTIGPLRIRVFKSITMNDDYRSTHNWEMEGSGGGGDHCKTTPSLFRRSGESCDETTGERRVVEDEATRDALP